MLRAHINYPVMPLPPIAAVLLEGFKANERCRATDFDLEDANAPKAWESDVEYQRACAFYSGARDRALTAGPKDNHADQAAALLVMVDELNRLLEDHRTIGEPPLDEAETAVIRSVREAAVQLLRWHFENGAGALRPVAADLGLIT